MKPPSPSVNTVTALCCSAMRSPRSVPDSGRPTECSARRSTAAAATGALGPQRRRMVVLASPARAARTLSARPAYPSRASSSSAAVSARSSVSGAGGLPRGGVGAGGRGGGVPRRGVGPAGRGRPVSVFIAFRYLRLHYSIVRWRLTGADQAVSSRGFCDRGLQPGLGQAYSRSGLLGDQPPSPSVQSCWEVPIVYARLGRFCFEHRRMVLMAWLVVFVVGFAFGSGVFARLKDSNGSASIESVKGFNILDDAASTGPGVLAVVDGARVADPRTRAAVGRLTAKLRALPHVETAVNAYGSPDPRLRAKDGRASLIVLTVRKNDDDPMAMHRDVDRIRDAVKGQVPGARVRVGGDLGVMRDEMMATQRDLFMGELIALPILLIALFFVFRGVRAALLPLAAALVTTA